MFTLRHTKQKISDDGGGLSHGGRRRHAQQETSPITVRKRKNLLHGEVYFAVSVDGKTLELDDTVYIIDYGKHRGAWSKNGIAQLKVEGVRLDIIG